MDNNSVAIATITTQIQKHNLPHYIPKILGKWRQMDFSKDDQEKKHRTNAAKIYDH